MSMKNLSHFRFLWLSAVVILLDQISKIIVKLKLPLFESRSIFGELLMLTHVQNTGAAFSISFGDASLNRIVFVGFSFVAMLFIIYLIYRTAEKLQLIALSLILGGAIGNQIDRILFGYVTDFLDMDFPDFIMARWPIYNLADSAIVVAMAFILVDLIFIKHPKKSEIHQEDSDDDAQIYRREDAI